VDPGLMGGADGHRTYLYSYIPPHATLINRNTLAALTEPAHWIFSRTLPGQTIKKTISNNNNRKNKNENKYNVQHRGRRNVVFNRYFGRRTDTFHEVNLYLVINDDAFKYVPPTTHVIFYFIE